MTDDDADDIENGFAISTDGAQLLVLVRDIGSLTSVMVLSALPPVAMAAMLHDIANKLVSGEIPSSREMTKH